MEEEFNMPRPKKNNLALTELERDLLEATHAMLAHTHSKKMDPTTTHAIADIVNVKEIRTNLHLTQEQFARFIGASVHAVRHWENGRRTPDGTARRLLCILKANPRAVLDALGQPESE
jgi:putative transcriptional regulator